MGFKVSFAPSRAINMLRMGSVVFFVFLVFLCVCVSCGFFMLHLSELVEVRSFIASGKVLLISVFFISVFLVVSSFLTFFIYH